MAHHAYRSTASERRPSRRGHVPHISISDTNHHVTEAIGGMYGSDEEEFPSPKSAKGRPLSFLPTSQDAYSHDSWFEKRSSPPRSPHGSSPLQDRIVVRGSSRDHESMRKTSLSNVEEQRSPPLLSRRSSSQENTAVQSFPLNNIDYESSPAAVAQELSNLQAIRRMSMNVNMADPDLPSFGGFGPAIDPPAPHSDDEGDAARLFWVPARVHPELAPKEFKTFIEDRVDRLKHRSDDGTLLPETIERKNSEGGGINRKKSMLSRQIKSDKGYEDGAARLERKRSEAGGEHPTANLAELETLVNDPSSLIRTMSIDDSRTSQDSGIGVLEEDDKPLMGGLASGLKRSTRTAYRRGSLRKGERAGGLRRGIGRAGDAENETQSAQSSPHVGEDEAIQGISRVQTDPIPTATSTFEPAENFSRPGRRARLGGASNPAEEQSRHSAHHGISRRSEDSGGRPSQDVERASLHVRPRVSAEGRTSPGPPSPQLPVPHIVETPPPPEAKPATYLFPERKSSMLQREQIAQGQLQQSSGYGQQQMRPQGPLIQGARTKHLSDKSQTSLDDLSSNPSPVPGMGASRTDEMTMVPTFENLKKVEDKSSRKTSWGWLNKDKAKDKSDKELQRNREKEQEREREAQRLREKEEKDKERDSKLRKPKVSSKLAGQDKTRLDVLQTSIDGGASRGRESLVLNREDIKLEEERRKESTRKKGEDGKKEKDNGLLSALFGGGKRSKSSDHDNAKKRLSNRSLSPEPPPRVLRPDVDYNWTRFSILEERAIYRMAHIKLANPKRALYSQVLLSNFMYSYLAKVQLMHPQMQVAGAGGPGTHGQGAAASKQKGQKKAANNGQQSGDESMDEFDQYRRWQEAQTHPDGPAEQPQAAETGSLGRPRNNDGRGVNPQNRGMNGAGGHRAAPAGYGGSAAVGGAAAGAVGGGVTAAAANTPPVEQDYSTAYLGYGKQQLLEQGFDYDDDEGDSWSSGRDSNMFAGLS